MTPIDLAKGSFVPLRKYSVHPDWRQSGDLETLRSMCRCYELTKVDRCTCTVCKVSLVLDREASKHQAPEWTVFACHCQDKPLWRYTIPHTRRCRFCSLFISLNDNVVERERMNHRRHGTAVEHVKPKNATLGRLGM